MLKRLTSKEVSIQFAPKLFTELKNESKSKIRDYFVFQEDAVRLIRYGIKYSSIYHNFIISGYDGLGKRTGILNLLQKEYPKKKVIYEPNPNFSNLFGFYENGEFIPGHLNSLNDGFLIIPLSKLLIDLHLYDFLKISLINKEINFKNLPEINYFKDFPRTTKPIQFQTRVILLSDDAGFEKILKSDSEVG
ncbi:MAG: AAA family ATPase, partial [Leptospiraceae bacterium]|nr:AAA family ATPase [Leptospiraceae bacterium]